MNKISSRLLSVGAAISATLLFSTPALAAATVSSTVLETGKYASSSAYNPAGTTVAIAAFGDSNTNPVVPSEVDFIDVATNTVTAVTDQSIVNAVNLVWSPDGAWVYALNYDGGIAIINTATYTVTDTLSTTDATTYSGLSITPDGDYLVVGDYSTGDNTAVVNIANDSYVTLNYDADYTVATFVSSDGTKAYVVDYYGVVNVFDLTDVNYTLIDTLQFSDMSAGGMSVCSSFDQSTLYMIGYDNSVDVSVSRLNLETGASISTTATIPESKGCNMTPDGDHLLVAAYDGSNPSKVYEFDGTSLDFVTDYVTSEAEYTDVIASSPLSCDVYVSNYEPSTNILNFPCDATLADTGVDSESATAFGGFAIAAVLAGLIAVIVRRRTV